MEMRDSLNNNDNYYILILTVGLRVCL